MYELRERVRGVVYDGIYDVHIHSRENVTGSLQIMFLDGGKWWDKGNM